VCGWGVVWLGAQCRLTRQGACKAEFKGHVACSEYNFYEGSNLRQLPQVGIVIARAQRVALIAKLGDVMSD
jgi:hypothetical protein